MFGRFITIEGWLITYGYRDSKGKIREGFKVSWDTNGFSKIPQLPKDVIDLRVRPIGKARKLK